MSWFKRKSYPSYWADYCAHFNTPLRQNLEDLRFIVFDTETTGLNTKSDRILSIGCVGIYNLNIKVSDQLELYLEQDQFDINTVKIHGLLKGGHISKTSEEEAIKKFLEYSRNAILVAHHAAFDVTMINEGLKRLGLPKLKNKVLDTGHLFLKTKPETSKQHHGLDDLANQYNIPLHDRHTASGDAYITALLFIKIVKQLSASHTLTLKDLLRRNDRIGLL